MKPPSFSLLQSSPSSDPFIPIINTAAILMGSERSGYRTRFLLLVACLVILCSTMVCAQATLTLDSSIECNSKVDLTLTADILLGSTYRLEISDSLNGPNTLYKNIALSLTDGTGAVNTIEIQNWLYPGSDLTIQVTEDGVVGAMAELILVASDFTTQCTYDSLCTHSGDSSLGPCGTVVVADLTSSTFVNHYWTFTPSLSTITCDPDGSQTLTATPHSPDCYMIPSSGVPIPWDSSVFATAPCTLPQSIPFEIGSCIPDCDSDCNTPTCTSPIEDDASNTGIWTFESSQCGCPSCPPPTLSLTPPTISCNDVNVEFILLGNIADTKGPYLLRISNPQAPATVYGQISITPDNTSTSPTTSSTITIPSWIYPANDDDLVAIEVIDLDTDNGGGGLPKTIAALSSQPITTTCVYEYYCEEVGVPSTIAPCDSVSADTSTSESAQNKYWTYTPDLASLVCEANPTPGVAATTASPNAPQCRRLADGVGEDYNDTAGTVSGNPCGAPPANVRLTLGPCIPDCSNCGNLTCGSLITDNTTPQTSGTFQFDQSKCDCTVPCASPSLTLTSSPISCGDAVTLTLAGNIPPLGSGHEYRLTITHASTIYGDIEIAIANTGSGATNTITIDEWVYPGSAVTIKVVDFDGAASTDVAPPLDLTSAEIPSDGCIYASLCAKVNDPTSIDPCGTITAADLTSSTITLSEYWNFSPSALSHIICDDNNTQTLTAEPNLAACYLTNRGTGGTPIKWDSLTAVSLKAMPCTLPTDINFEIGTCTNNCSSITTSAACSTLECKASIWDISTLPSTEEFILDPSQCHCNACNLSIRGGVPSCFDEDIELVFTGTDSAVSPHMIKIWAGKSSDNKQVGQISQIQDLTSGLIIPLWKYPGSSFAIQLVDNANTELGLIPGVIPTTPCDFDYHCDNDPPDPNQNESCGTFTLIELTNDPLPRTWTLDTPINSIPCLNGSDRPIPITAAPNNPRCVLYTTTNTDGLVQYVDDVGITPLEPCGTVPASELFNIGKCTPLDCSCTAPTCSAEIVGLSPPNLPLNPSMCLSQCPGCTFFPNTTPTCLDGLDLTYTGTSTSKGYIEIFNDDATPKKVGRVEVDDLSIAPIKIPSWVYPGEGAFTIELFDNTDASLATTTTAAITTPCDYVYHCTPTAAPNTPEECGIFDTNNLINNDNDLYTLSPDPNTLQCTTGGGPGQIIEAKANQPSCVVFPAGVNTNTRPWTNDDEKSDITNPCGIGPTAQFTIGDCTSVCTDCNAITCSAKIDGSSSPAFDFPDSSKCFCPECISGIKSLAIAPASIHTTITPNAPEVTFTITTTGTIDKDDYRFEWSYKRPGQSAPSQSNQLWVPIRGNQIAISTIGSAVWTIDEKNSPIFDFAMFESDPSNATQLEIFIRMYLSGSTPIAYVSSPTTLLIQRSCDGRPALFTGINESCFDDAQHNAQLECTTGDQPDSTNTNGGPCARTALCNDKEPQCSNGGFYSANPTPILPQDCASTCTCPDVRYGGATCHECTSCPTSRGKSSSECRCDCHTGFFNGSSLGSDCTIHGNLILQKPSPNLVAAASDPTAPPQEQIDNFNIAAQSLRTIIEGLIFFPATSITIPHNQLTHDPNTDTATIYVSFTGLCDIAASSSSSSSSSSKTIEQFARLFQFGTTSLTTTATSSSSSLSVVKNNFSSIHTAAIPTDSEFYAYAFLPNETSLTTDQTGLVGPPVPNPPKKDDGTNIVVIVVPIVVVVVVLIIIAILVYCFCFRNRNGDGSDQPELKRDKPLSDDSAHLELY